MSCESFKINKLKWKESQRCNTKTKMGHKMQTAKVPPQSRCAQGGRQRGSYDEAWSRTPGLPLMPVFNHRGSLFPHLHNGDKHRKSFMGLPVRIKYTNATMLMLLTIIQTFPAASTVPTCPSAHRDNRVPHSFMYLKTRPRVHALITMTGAPR